MRSLGAQGKTVLVSSHILAEVEQVADTVSIIGTARCSPRATSATSSAAPASARCASASRRRPRRDRAGGRGFGVTRDGGLLVVGTDDPAAITRSLAGTGSTSASSCPCARPRVGLPRPHRDEGLGSDADRLAGGRSTGGAHEQHPRLARLAAAYRASTPRTSFVGLVGVELRRLWWRRLTKAVLVAIVVVIGVAGFSIYKDTSPESLAERLDAYSQTVKQIEADQANVTPEQRAEQIAACKADQAKSQQDGGLSDFDCESIFAPPSPADFGLINTTRDADRAQHRRGGLLRLRLPRLHPRASFVAAEFASGSMGNWLTFQPRRLRVASAKLVAATIGGLAVAALVTGLSTALAAMITTVNRPGADLPLADAPSDGSLVQELLRISAAIALGGLGGAAIGLLLRSTAGVVGAVLGWAVVMEGLVAQGLANGRLQPWLVRANLDAFRPERDDVLRHDVWPGRLLLDPAAALLHARLGLPGRHRRGRRRRRPGGLPPPRRQLTHPGRLTSRPGHGRVEGWRCRGVTCAES